MFEAHAGRERVLCQISREALEDHFGADALTTEGRLDVFESIGEKLRRWRASSTFIGRFPPTTRFSLRPQRWLNFVSS